MKENYDRALEWTLAWEGGYVNDPHDPGGATNMGITQRVYDGWRLKQGLARRPVREIGPSEVRAIYRRQYWDAVRGDDLPPGIDAAVFDFAVHSGPARAVKFLQRLVGVEADGIMGHITLAAIHAGTGSWADLIRRYCDARLAWLRRLRLWSRYGHGWERRVRDIRRRAVALANGSAQVAQIERPAPAPKGRGPEKVTAVVADLVRDPAGVSSVGSVLGALGALAQGTGPIQWAIAIVLVLAAVGGMIALLRREPV